MPTDDEKMKEWLSGPEFFVSGTYPLKHDISGTPDSSVSDDVRIEATKTITTETGHFLDRLMTRCGTWAKIRGVVSCVIRFVDSFTKKGVS